MSQTPFKMPVNRPTKAGEYAHSDVCDPMSVESLGGARYYIAIKDDASGFLHIYFLRHKSRITERFKDSERMVADKYG